VALVLCVSHLVAVLAASGALAQTSVTRDRSSGEIPTDITGGGVFTAAQEAQLLQQRNVELLGAGPVDPETYVLGPGDLLALEVMGAFSLSAEAVVSADGSVTFPQLGTFDMAGKTLQQAREMLQGRGGEIIKSSGLQLVLKSTRSFKVYVVGGVASSGAVRGSATMRVSEAIVAADGFGGGANTRLVRLLHDDGTEEITDLLPFLFRGDFSTNPSLRDGDVVLVEPRSNTVDFTGAILRPGIYDLKEGDELSSMLQLLELTPTADSSFVTLQRFRSSTDWDTLRISLPSILAGDVQIPLQSRDRIIVPFRGQWGRGATVEIRGAVRWPGCRWPPGRGDSRTDHLATRFHCRRQSELVSGAGSSLCAGSGRSTFPKRHHRPHQGEGTTSSAWGRHHGDSDRWFRPNFGAG
jgi:protein involved in polysaccharide export with SLBB domain